MIKRFFNSQAKTITFAAFLLAGSAFFSRSLGLLRDRLLAARFGAGQELDIYFAAFRIPDFVYGILIMGGIAAVFLPVFSEHFKKGEKEAWEFTNNLLNTFLVLLVLVCGLLFAIAPLLIKLVAPGFSAENQTLAVSLTRIMFLSPILFGLSSVFSGILHYFNRFLAYSAAPVLYNLGIIFGIIFLVPMFGIWGLAYGVILGALVHWLVQIPAAIMSGYKHSFSFNLRSPGLLKVFRLMAPRTIGAAAYHVNLIIITAIASTLTAGSIAVFNFSNNLQHFPIGLFGVSFAMASFPVLSRAWSEGARDRFLQVFSLTLRQIIFVIIPVALLIFLLRAQIIRLVLGAGEFGWLETRLTAASLGLFALGILFASLVPFLARTFYSIHNTRTPTVIGLASVLLNLLLAFYFIHLLSYSNFFRDAAVSFLKLEGIGNIQVIGLPLALSFSVLFQVFLLLFFLKRNIREIELGDLWRSFGKMLVAASLMGLSSYLVLQLAAILVGTDRFWAVFFQAFASFAVGAAVYLLFSFLLKCPEVYMLFKKK